MITQLQITALSVAYRRHAVLTDFTLPLVYGGGLVALVGPNGAGKTTLIRTLAGLLPATGTVRLDEEDLTRLPLRVRARHVAYMPQTLPAGVALTVLEAVVAALLASPASRDIASEDEAANAAMVQLDLLDAGTLAGRRLDALSGGQRQLAGLAQALVRRPRLLLLDEPTSALDLRHQHRVIALVRDYARASGAVVMLVVHDLPAAANLCDRLIVLDHGSLAADGPPGQALTADLLARVWRVRARVERCSRGQVQVMVDGPA